jgi:hypothetical protein
MNRPVRNRTGDSSADRLGPAFGALRRQGRSLPPLVLGAALRCSWHLMRQRAALPWLPGAWLLGAACTGAVWLLVRQFAQPLRSAARDAVLAGLTPNTCVAHAAGVLVPVATAALLCTAVALPPAHAYLTAACLRPGSGGGR